MNYKQFLVELGKVGGGWVLVDREAIRTKRDYLSPILAVYKRKTKDSVDASDNSLVDEYGKELGLRRITIDKICAAADHVKYNDERVRRDLLKAIRLIKQRTA